jgi:hypothetical protein
MDLFSHILPVTLLQCLHQEPHSPRVSSLALGPGEEHVTDLAIQVIPWRGRELVTEEFCPESPATLRVTPH